MNPTSVTMHCAMHNINLPVCCRTVVVSGSITLVVGKDVDTSEPVVMSLVTSVVISVVISGSLSVGFKVVMSGLVMASVLVEGGEEVVISDTSVIEKKFLLDINYI